MIKVDIFSGFLGAGKTTLIKKLIEEAYLNENIVLIENEFGEIGVDGGFLKDTGVKINEMTAGCICCTLVGDFGRALEQVIRDYSPDRIIIEPSGVGKLSDVIIAVQDLQNDEIALNGFTTVVDAKKCRMYMKNFGEFFNNQVENAGTIILSHVDNISSENLNETIALLRECNTHASIITTDWNELNGKDMLDTMEEKNTLSAELDKLREEAYAEESEHMKMHDHEQQNNEHEGHAHHDHYDHDKDNKYEAANEHGHSHQTHRSNEHEAADGHAHHHADEIFDEFGVETVKTFDKGYILEALDSFAYGDEYGTVLRAKGIVEGNDGKWIHFDYIPGEPDVRNGSAAVTGMICVIGVDINKDKIRSLFD